MNGFLHPERALWALLVLVLAAGLYWVQRGALRWLLDRVSPRFLHRITRYQNLRSLSWHWSFLTLLALLPVGAAMAPWTASGEGGKQEARSIVILVDASLSMGAGDTGAEDGDGNPLSRFDQAKLFARELVRELPEARFALVTFSGEAVVHTPPTYDRHALDQLLGTLKYHLHTGPTGTRFTTGFQAVAHFLGDDTQAFQVVLLSDGELTAPDSFESALTLFESREIPVHTVALGSSEGQSRVLYDLEDVMDALPVEDRRIVSEYTTYRDEETLADMSRRTGGQALVVEADTWVEDLVPTLADYPALPVLVARSGIKDLSPWFTWPFLVGFLWETLRSPRKKRVEKSTK